jgi:hypothetical protein
LDVHQYFPAIYMTNTNKHVFLNNFVLWTFAIIWLFNLIFQFYFSCLLRCLPPCFLCQICFYFEF